MLASSCRVAFSEVVPCNGMTGFCGIDSRNEHNFADTTVLTSKEGRACKVVPDCSGATGF
jgi:hypothetical protein